MSANAPPSTFAVDGLTPSSVVEPSTLDELSSALRDANERGAAVIPWGAGRHMSLGNVPARYDIALRTTKLNRVIEHEPADMTVTVEAGMTFGALQTLLAGHGQFLPIDAPADATIGGVLAANVSGPSRHAYGLPRDWLIGCRIVLADGTIVKGGGRVVKNVAGYDLPKLAVGSLGTLGVIAEATFKLAPVPSAQETLVVRCETIDEAAKLIFTADERSLALRAVAIRSFGAAQGKQAQGPCDAAFWIAGTRAAVERTRAEIEQLGTTERGDQSWWTASREATGAVWLKASSLPSDIAGFCEHIASNASSVVAYPTAGMAIVRLSEAETDERARRIQEARSYVTEYGGSLVITSAPIDVKKRVDVWGAPLTGSGPAIDVMRALKQQFDPRATLNPGRFIGGI
jgi:glycolate oxidase FAD binding subunit